MHTTHRLKTWSKFSILGALIVIAILYRYTDKTVMAPTQVTSITEKAASTLNGVVQENENLVPADGNASLKIRLSDNTIATVTYEWGRLTPQGSPTCENKAAAIAGAALKPNTPVEVYARITGNNTYSTCEDASYYIHPLNN